MKKRELNIGEKLGDFTIIGEVPFSDRHGKPRMAICQCKCGTISNMYLGNLFRKNKPFFACRKCYTKKILLTGLHKTHGMEGTCFYSIWGSIKARCSRPTCKEFKYYGGRGIKICLEWNFFKNFKKDMYESYLQHISIYGKKNTSIDRMDNNGNYEKNNCQWATRVEQANNTSTNHFITYNGITMTATAWAYNLGLSRGNAIVKRLQRGWDLKSALTTPAINKNI